VEFNMRSRFLLGVAAPALAALAFLSTAEPASAQYYGYRGFGWGAAGLAAGIVGGALAVATAPLWASGYYGYNSYYPTYGYGPSAYGQTLAYAPNYGYGYSPGYSYGPGYGYASNYGYGYGGYSPGYGYGGIYASAGRGVRVPARHPHHANYR
jgi:hypothetical protein